MGDDVMVSFKGSESRQRSTVMHFVPHPEFSKQTFQHDIAVIRVRNCYNVNALFNFSFKHEIKAVQRLTMQLLLMNSGFLKRYVVANQIIIGAIVLLEILS